MADSNGRWKQTERIAGGKTGHKPTEQWVLGVGRREKGSYQLSSEEVKSGRASGKNR